jgi:hypothetical protein
MPKTEQPKEGEWGMDWRPIETAPKDGTRVLVSVGGRVEISFYIDEVTFSYGIESRRRQEWYSDRLVMIGCEKPQPTHWMALPVPAVAHARESEDA